MGNRIQEPIAELAAMRSLVGLKVDELARRADVPPTRLKNAFDGGQVLTIDDLTRCKAVLREELLRHERTEGGTDGR